MPRKGHGDVKPDIYTEASGYFLRDFDLSRQQEFNNPTDHPKDWKDFEYLLGNCCDRLLRDIDDRFKYLAEYLWDKIEFDCATPKVIKAAFENNLDQIDQYLALQFDYAKQQLENVMRSNRATEPPRATPSSESAGFSTPTSRSSGTPSSGSVINSGSRRTPSGTTATSQRVSSRQSRTDGTHTTGDSSTVSRRPSRSTLPSSKSRTTASSAPDSDSASYASADDGSPRSRPPPSSEGDEARRRRRSSGGSQTVSSGYSAPYRDRQELESSSSRDSFMSRCRRALGDQGQLPFAWGVLAGMAAILAIISLFPYVSPYLPAWLTDYIPAFQTYSKDTIQSMSGRPPPPGPRYGHLKESGHRRKPYDAFWTSCGHSFVDWWTYSWRLLFGDR